jgi:Caspase domain
MMVRFRLNAVVAGCIFLFTQTIAQNLQLHQKPNREIFAGQKNYNNHLEWAMPTSDGGFIAIGRTEGVGYSGDDIAVVKVAADGVKVFEKTIGTVFNDRCYTLCEDMFGRIHIVGTRELDNKTNASQIWVKTLSDKGEIMNSREILKTTHETNIFFIKALEGGYELVGIENGYLKGWLINTEGGDSSYEFRANCLKRLAVQKIQVIQTEEFNYIYGYGWRDNSSPKRGEAFLMKIKDGVVLNDCSFPDINAINIGKFSLSRDSNTLFLVGTTETKSTGKEEDIFAIKIDTSLVKGRGYFAETYAFRNADEGWDIVQKGKDSLTIYGTTKSHNMGNGTSDFFLFNVSAKDGRLFFLGKEPYFHWGDEQDDRFNALLTLTNGSRWYVGTKDRGNALVRNLDFYFARLDAPKQAPFLQQPIEKRVETPTFAATPNATVDTLTAGSSNFINLQLHTNAEQNNLRGYKIRALTDKGNQKVYIPSTIDLSPFSKRDILLRLPINVESDLKEATQLPIKLCLYNPQGLCLDTLEKLVYLKPTPKSAYQYQTITFKNQMGGDTLVVGEIATLSVVLKNTGNAVGENTNLRIIPTNALSLMGENSKMMNLSPNTTQKIDFQFIANDSELKGFVDIKLEISDKNTPSVIQTFKKVIVRKRPTTTLAAPIAMASKPNQPTVKPTNEPKTDVSKAVKDAKKTEVVVTNVPIKEDTKNEKPPVTTPTTTGLGQVIVRWTQNFKSEKLTVVKEEFDIRVVATGLRELKATNFYVLHNGQEKNMDGIKMDEVDLSSTPAKQQKFDTYLDFKLKLQRGLNKIVVRVKDISSEDATTELIINYRPLDKGVLYVLSVGVPDKKGLLKYTQKDATDFAEMFRAKSGNQFGETQILTLTSTDSTTAARITTEVNKFKKMSEDGLIGSNDALVVYLSTHGIMGEEGELRFLGSSYERDNQKFTSMDFQTDLVKPLSKLPCSKYFFIDACKSGAVSKDLKRQNIREEAEVSTSLKSILANNGVFALASCSADESSYEDKEWENGAFTKALKDILADPKMCEKLDGKSGSKDKALSVEEIYPMLRDKVQTMVKMKRNEKQTPIFYGTQKSENKPLLGY